MPTLSYDQLQRLRGVLDSAAKALAVSTFGLKLSRAEIQKLVDRGYLKAEDDVDDLIGQAYRVGAIMAAMPPQMSVGQLSAKLKAEAVPLSDVQKRAISYAESRAGQFCVGLGTRAAGEVTSAVIPLDEALEQQQREGIQSKTAEAIAERQSRGQLRTELRHVAEDMARDWDRIAFTELHMAHQVGLADSLQARKGAEAMMAKIPEDSACPQCLKLYLGDDGLPIVRPVSWWRAQGVSNVGRKQSEWKPVLGGAHPWCCPPGTLVLTHRGDVAIENVRLGDWVLTHRRRWRPVIQTHMRYHDGYLVSVVEGRLSVTGNHGIYVGSTPIRADALSQGIELCLARLLHDANAQQRPTHPCEIGSFARILFGLTGGGVPVAAIDFNGELFLWVSEVNEKTTNSQIGIQTDSTSGQPDVNQTFSFGMRPASGVGYALNHTCLVLDGPTPCFVSRRGHSLALSNARALMATALGCGYASLDMPSFADAMDHDPATHPEFAGYRLYGLLLVEVQSQDKIHIKGCPPRSGGDSKLTKSLQDDVTGDSEFHTDLTCGHTLVSVEPPQRRFTDIDASHVPVLALSSARVTPSTSHYYGMVHNLSVAEDESYHAGGIAVSNCACEAVSVPPGMTFNEDFDLVPIADTAEEA